MIRDAATVRDAATDLARMFPGQSELAACMRTFDWSATDLGPPQQWESNLRTAVSLCLTSRIPIVMYWGEHFRTLYNDPYISFLGSTKHPRFLGQPARECWSEIWDTIGPMLADVRANGRATWSEDLLMFFARHLPLEEVYVRFTFGPLLSCDGATVDGIFCPCTETTERVIGERRVETLRRLSLEPTETRSVDVACRESATALAHNPRDIPFAAIYLVDDKGASARLVATAGLPTDRDLVPAVVALSGEAGTAPWPFAAVARTRARAEVSIQGVASPFPGGPYPEPARTAVVLPIGVGVADRLAGFLVVGVSPRRVLDEAYRTFFDLVAGHIGMAISTARAYEAERMRAEALAELDRVKTIFFSNVSHELRTPLTLMLGPLEDLLAASDGLSRPSADRALLAVAHRNALRLLKLVNALLDFSRIEAGRAEACYQPTDLATWTLELASAFRSAVAKAGLRFRVECPPLPEPVYVDRDMWEKIVLNLLSNALKFTLDGEIAIVLRARPVEGMVDLVVRDSGAGIPSDEVPRIFERFHRVHGTRARTHEGSGIGLALVRELVRLHGGAIAVQSEVGRGTSFTISLPFGRAHLPPDRVRADGASVMAPNRAFLDEALLWLADDVAPTPVLETAALSEARPRRRGRILLADDNADMRAYVQRLLREHGYDVTCATNGQLALQLAMQDRPDLVVTDVMMPELDGFGLLAALRSCDRTRSLPVIMLSARAGEEARIEGLDRGADDYVIKPFTGRELLARVGAHLSLSLARREATESVRLATESANAKLAELSRQLMDGHERERARVARELHDDVGQRMLGLTMQLHGLMQAAVADSLEIRGDVTEICRQFGELADDIQAISHRLHSSKLAVLGLSTAATSLCQSLADRHAMTIAFQESDVPDALPETLAVGLFRVLQEALSNAIKHSGVRRVTVALRGTLDDIEMEVVDEGAGFDPELEMHGRGLGLISMRERVLLLGGEFHVESRPGAGARVRARVPLTATSSQ